MSDEILMLKSPDSFSAGAYTESDKALCGKSLATIDYDETIYCGTRLIGILEAAILANRSPRTHIKVST